jgi:hypothetical protein
MPVLAQRLSHTPAPDSRPRQTRPHTAVAPFLVHVGPYAFHVRLVRHDEMPRRRSVALVDFVQQVFYIRSDQAQSPQRLLRAFLVCLLEAIHYANGLRYDVDLEETFTHSAAVGLAQFAVANPAAWVWVNALLDRIVGNQKPEYARLASLRRASLRGMPRELSMGAHRVQLRLAPKRAAERLGLWGWMDASRQELVVGRHVVGMHFAVILLHEIWHLLHLSAGLDDGYRFSAYRRAQPRLLVRFVRSNPQAWHWLVRLLNALRCARSQRELSMPAA